MSTTDATTGPPTVNLGVLPDAVRSSATEMAAAAGETLHGWRALTEPNPNAAGWVRPKGYLIITDKGAYECDLTGVFYRASMLHKF